MGDARSGPATGTDPPDATVAADADRRLARDVLRELVELDTTRRTTDAARAVARRLVAAGLPGEDVRVIGPHPDKHNLVARLRGDGGAGPLLLLAHLDVVEARPEEWSVEPFRLVEREGWLYGRGTLDDKGMAALWVATLLRLHTERVPLRRDVVLALTADEEGGDHNGAQWLLDEHRALVEAELGLNEGGYGRIRDGRRIANQLQLSEKLCVFFELEASGRGGHSSLPAGENAILRLADALRRVAAHRFPARLTEATREFFRRSAELETGQVADDMRAIVSDTPDPQASERLCAVPYFNALLRTTCTPTRLEAGQANNVLPTTARAVLDCRILPGEPPAEVERTLSGLVAGLGVRVRPLVEAKPSPPSPLRPDVVAAVERITGELWPGVPVVPVMSVGATDSLRFRQSGIPMYGVSGLFLGVEDVRAHAADERIGVDAFYEAGDFLFRLVKALATSGR